MAGIPLLASVLPNSPGSAMQTGAGSSEAFGGAEARGLAVVGQALGQTGEMFYRQGLAAQDEYNQAAENELDTSYAKLISKLGYDPTDGYFGKSKMNAVDAYQTTYDAAAKAREAFLKDAPNDRVRAAFERVSNTRLQGFQESMSRHATGERKAWLVETAQARIDQAAEDAADNWNDPVKFQQNLALAQSEASRLADINGMGPEATAQLQQSVTSSVYSAQLERMASSNPGAVLAFVNSDQGKAALTTKDASALFRTATAEANRRESEARQAATDARIAASEAKQAEMAKYGNDIAMLGIKLNDAKNRGDLAGVMAAEKQAYAIGGAIGMDKVDHIIIGADDARAKVELVQAENERMTIAFNAGALDPNQEANKKGINNIFVSNYLPQINAMPPNQQAWAVAAFSAQGGIVPPVMVSEISGKLSSGSADKKLQAAEMYGAIKAANPALAEQFSADDRRAAELILTAKEYGNQDPAGYALERMQVTPADRAAREDGWSRLMQENNTSGLKDWAKSQEIDGVPLNDEQQASLERLARDEYIAGLPLDKAQAEALRMLQGKWGVTGVATAPGGYFSFGSREQVPMAYPPEKFYGMPTMTPQQNADWQREQLLADTNALLVESGAVGTEPIDDRVSLMRDPARTRPDGKPVYIIMLKGADGQDYPVRDRNGKVAPWTPDWGASPEAKRRNEDLMKGVDDARATRADPYGAARDRYPDGL